MVNATGITVATAGTVNAVRRRRASATWADWMAAEAKAGRTVWAYFNNDIDAHAVHDARTLKAMVRQLRR